MELCPVLGAFRKENDWINKYIKYFVGERYVKHQNGGGIHSMDCAVVNSVFLSNQAIVRGCGRITKSDVLGKVAICVKDNVNLYDATIKNKELGLLISGFCIDMYDSSITGTGAIHFNQLALGNKTKLTTSSHFSNIVNLTINGPASVCFNFPTLLNADIGEYAYIRKASDIITIHPIGSRNDHVTFYKTKQNGENGIGVRTGCFSGSINDFRIAVDKTHKDNKYGRQYHDAIKFAENHFCRFGGLHV